MKFRIVILKWKVFECGLFIYILWLKMLIVINIYIKEIVFIIFFYFLIDEDFWYFFGINKFFNLYFCEDLFLE